MKKNIILVYGIFAYALANLAVVLSIAFVGDMFIDKTIDRGGEAPYSEAIVVNLLLLGLFAVQHSGMARQAFKRWLTAFVPEPAERSTYVLASALLLLLIIWQWRAMPEVIWSVTNEPGYSILMGLFWIGWVIVLASTWLIDHFDLFGLKQVFQNWKGAAASPPQFKTPLLYQLVRHPIYFGFLLAFWATPHMTAGHLLFAIATTGYILIGIWFEERDLVRVFGDAYRDYKARVPMVVPWPKSRK